MTQRIGVKVEPAGTGSPFHFQNLPSLLTPLIGREQQEQAIRSLLLRPEVRLLTLTCTAGIGKTRLAQQVATDLSERELEVLQLLAAGASNQEIALALVV